MSSDSYQLLGMAERGMLPAFFARRSRHGTPLVGILFSASGVLLLSSMSFQEIVAAENFLYCFGMLLEFLAFVLLRVRRPDAPRPYRIPLGTGGCVAMLVLPTALIVLVLALSTVKVALVSLGAVAVGLVLEPGLRFVEKTGWLRFEVNSDLPDINVTRTPVATA
jgi:amino acid transporter